jgi:hypothetical protein
VVTVAAAAAAGIARFVRAATAPLATGPSGLGLKAAASAAVIVPRGLPSAIRRMAS